MKKILVVLFYLLAVSNIQANPIDTLVAKKVAKSWFIARANTSYKSSSMVKISKTITIKKDNNEVYHIVNYANNGGFAIIAADDNVTPILGYGFKNNFKEDNKPPQLIWLLNTYAEQINIAKKSKLKTASDVKEKWKRLIKGDTKSTKANTKAASPLLQVEWAQGTGWNTYCPSDASGPDNHALVGCVAVAMAQVMKYWNYPTVGKSSNNYTHATYGTLSANFAATEYDWWNMDNSSATNAAALLLYHCGVAVNMQYGPSSSGAYTYGNEPSAYHAMSTYFGYSVSQHYGDLTDAFLVSELDAGRPVIYSGTDSDGNNGHAFVIDGYEGTNYFNVNWGWGGSYNGHFYLNDLTPGSNDFSFNNDAIYGIRPNIGLCDVDVDFAFTGILEVTCSITLSDGFSTDDFHGRIITGGQALKSVAVNFSTPIHGHAQLIIYDENNKEVKTLINRYLFKDNYEVFWDKTDNKGNPVKEGKYYYKLKTLKGEETKKLIIE